MTSDRISRRNKANAKKSTGPRTAAGKAIVAQNARRHGATGKPDRERVSTWLRIILDEPGLSIDDVLGKDRSMAALALAEAEARLVACQKAMTEFEQADKGGFEVLANEAPGVMGGLISGNLSVEQQISASTFLAQLRQALAVEKERQREQRLLKRYLREARSARKRAFQTWLEVRPPRADDMRVDQSEGDAPN